MAFTDYLIGAAAIGGVILLVVHNYRCPKCKQNFTRKFVDEEVVHSWVRIRKIHGTHGEREERDNMVKLRRYFICTHCGHQWHKLEEKRIY